MIKNLIGVLFDGVAYGSLLFIISVGLSVTMGLMNFINLAHGAFAMLGGYVCVVAAGRFGVPFLLALPLAFACAAVVGAVLERGLYRHFYRASPLDQVLFSIGLTFIAIALATYFFGSSQQPVVLPAFFQGQWHPWGLDLGIYRSFLVGFVLLIALALAGLVRRTRFGAQVRAAVDDEDVAAGLGVHVSRIFALTFALGSGLAGLGGALGIDVLGLDPTFPLKYLVYFLMVVTLGGAGTIEGPLVAALLLGVCDVAGKYYVPEFGAFVLDLLMAVVVIVYPSGFSGKRA